MTTPHLQVLHILPSLETGGAEKMAVHLAHELKLAGLRTGVVSFWDSSGSQLERILRSHAIPLWTLHKRRGFDFRLIGRLRTLLSQLQPDLVHTHLSALRYVVASLIGVKARPRLLHTVHRVAQRDAERGLRSVQHWCLRQGVAVVAVSEEVASSCHSVYRNLPVSVVPNGIPMDCMPMAPGLRASTRRALGIDEQRFVLCCVARLRAVKNHAALLQAFASGPHRTGAYLLLAGDGELRAELEALAQSLGIAAQTHFLGEREDVAEILNTSDLFVLPSISEGTPLSALEAMAAGLPVVATSVGGVPELIRDGVEGFLVPPGDVEALRHALLKIASDDKCRQAMSQAARVRVAGRYSSEVMAKSYLSEYERLGVRTARR